MAFDSNIPTTNGGTPLLGRLLGIFKPPNTLIDHHFGKSCRVVQISPRWLLNSGFPQLLKIIEIQICFKIMEKSLFVCFITKSFLTYSFVLPTPTLSTICRPHHWISWKFLKFIKMKKSWKIIEFWFSHSWKKSFNFEWDIALPRYTGKYMNFTFTLFIYHYL